MKKIYLSPLCEIFRINGTDHLLSASNPATTMEKPATDLYDDTDPMKPGRHKYDDEDDEDDEEDDWGY